MIETIFNCLKNIEKFLILNRTNANIENYFSQFTSIFPYYDDNRQILSKEDCEKGIKILTKINELENIVIKTLEKIIKNWKIKQK